jgi:hypothetical protein
LAAREWPQICIENEWWPTTSILFYILLGFPTESIGRESKGINVLSKMGENWKKLADAYFNRQLEFDGQINLLKKSLTSSNQTKNESNEGIGRIGKSKLLAKKLGILESSKVNLLIQNYYLIP